MLFRSGLPHGHDREATRCGDEATALHIPHHHHCGDTNDAAPNHDDGETALQGVELPVIEVGCSFPAMGSVVDIVCIGGAANVEQFARARVGDLERVWSRFDPSSELVALNRSGGRGAVPASELLRLAVDSSLHLWRATDGWFDPTTIDVLEWSGYDRSFERVRTRIQHRVEGPTPVVPTPAGVVVDHERGTITVPEGVRLDLGGVGKGLAADQIGRAHV